MDQQVPFDVEGGPTSSQMEDRDLRVVLEVVRGGPCFMDDLEGDVVGVDVRFEADRCHCDVVLRAPEPEAGGCANTKYSSHRVCDHCPGVVFSEYGCIPRYLRVGDGWFVMETYAADTDTVATLVGDVREVCERATVKSIVSTDGSEFAEISAVDVSTLTPKQREAVHRAKEAGYYDPDSSVSLDDIAGRLGISASALSQRLRRAEANVMRQLSCESDCWQSG